MKTTKPFEKLCACGCGRTFTTTNTRRIRFAPSCGDRLRRNSRVLRCACGNPPRHVRGARTCDACFAASIEAAKAKQRVKYAGPDGTRWCSICKQFKDPTAFVTKKGGMGKGPCAACRSGYHHNRNVKDKFGLDAESYADLLRQQNGRCAICLGTPRKYRLAVDHDHKTGAIRGLLCGRCNHRLLGSAHDSIEVLQRAIDYLSSPKAIGRVSDTIVINDAFKKVERAQQIESLPYGAVFVRRRGGGYVVAMTPEQFFALWRAATT